MSWAELFGAEGLALYQSMNKSANLVLFLPGRFQNFLCQVFVGETKGATEGVANQGLGEAAGEVFFSLGNAVAKLEVVGEGGAVVELAGGVDGGGGSAELDATFSVLGELVFFGAPFAGCIKILETEANWIDLAVATGALSLLLMGAESFAGAERLVGQTRELRDVGGRGWRGII